VAIETHVGPYRILRLINRGGQGSVYLGYDKRLQRRVAIKIYRLPAQRGARKQLLREAQTVAGLHSAKVVQIHDVIESSGHLAMVMEYVPGCDLEEFLASVRPSLASVLTIGADVAGALAVARQQHLVHGDLKAGNVLITDSGRAKLTDFGIARRAHSDPLTAGSPSALSPEQCLGKPLDLRSDLFALGCLLYRMLSGEQPFYRGGQLDTRLLLEQSPRPLAERVASDVVLPEDLVGLVTALLHKNPDERPTNTHQVRQVLRSVSREIPLAATHSLLQEARPCFRRESPDDIPPQVPAELGQAGRYRQALSAAGGSWFRQSRALFTWPARLVAALALLAAVSVPLVIALQDRATGVYIDAPLLRFSTDIDIPPEVSSRWLVAQVKQALGDQLGEIAVTGPLGANAGAEVYRSHREGEEQGNPEERLQLALRCVADLCVFAVTRGQGEEQVTRQGLLFPDMPLSQWRDIVHGTTDALFQ
jgi:tRNA A-37 threonylcarbamoyl transferase component Bud32